MSKIFLITILLTFFTTDIYASERSECLVAVEKGKEIINVNGMKVYSYNGKTYTFRDKSKRFFERTLR